MDYIKLSKEISFALRHAPQEYGLKLDEEGYVGIEELLSAINAGGDYNPPATLNDIIEMINLSEKKRHEINDGKIRALYGHTVPERIIKKEGTPPDVLFHGTSHKAIDRIMNEGLKPMKRNYVHLSADIDTAIRVGKRRDENPIILQIDVESAQRDGIKFFVGNDKVWLCDFLSPKYIKIT